MIYDLGQAKVASIDSQDVAGGGGDEGGVGAEEGGGAQLAGEDATGLATNQVANHLLCGGRKTFSCVEGEANDKIHPDHTIPVL